MDLNVELNLLFKDKDCPFRLIGLGSDLGGTASKSFEYPEDMVFDLLYPNQEMPDYGFLDLYIRNISEEEMKFLYAESVDYVPDLEIDPWMRNASDSLDDKTEKIIEEIDDPIIKSYLTKAIDAFNKQNCNAKKELIDAIAHESFVISYNTFSNLSEDEQCAYLCKEFEEDSRVWDEANAYVMDELHAKYTIIPIRYDQENVKITADYYYCANLSDLDTSNGVILIDNNVS